MRLRRMLVAAALLATLAYVGICMAVYVLQDRLLYFPVPQRAVPSPLLVLDRPGARVLVSTRPAGGPDAVVYFGGNAEDASAAIPLLAKAWPGAAIYALHYRGYGGSGGHAREADLVGDGLELAQRARARHPALTLVGRSLGSGIATQVAAAAPARRLVLVTPYASIAGLGAARFPWLPTRLLMRDRYDSAVFAPRITAPTTIIAASRDAVVPRWSTDRLAAAFAPGVAQVEVIDGAGHNDLSDDPRYLAALRRAR